MTKKRLFVDMDGTLAKWNWGATQEQLLSDGYFSELLPLDTVTVLAQVKNYKNIYILSSVLPEKPLARQEKLEWLTKYLPDFPLDHCFFPPCGMSKCDYIRQIFGCVDESFVLLDDYSVNLHAWEGIGVKLLNGANGSHGTWHGLAIWHEEAAALEKFFHYFAA